MVVVVIVMRIILIEVIMRTGHKLFGCYIDFGSRKRLLSTSFTDLVWPSHEHSLLLKIELKYSIIWKYYFRTVFFCFSYNEHHCIHSSKYVAGLFLSYCANSTKQDKQVNKIIILSETICNVAFFFVVAASRFGHSSALFL